MKQIILIGLVFLLTLNLVTALGIQPAKTTIIFEQSPPYSGQFWVINEEGREFNVKLYTQGDLASYIKLKSSELSFSGERSKLVEWEANLPAQIPPGISIAEIVIEEEINHQNPEIISSKLLLKHKVIIQGEYPDKYVDVKVNFQESSDKISLISEVENKGKQDLGSVQTTFYVKDKDQQEHVLETTDQPLKKTENKLFSAEINKTFFGKGEFTVSARTQYDDLEVELVKEMRLGQPEVDITYFTPFFLANEVNEYSMDLLNQWNKQIKNVFVDVDVKKNNQTIGQFRTQSVDIEGLMTERLKNYFDARNKEEGTYTFDLVVNFWNNYRMEKKTYPRELLSQTEFENRQKLSGFATGILSEGSWQTAVLILFGLILVLSSIYVVYRYKHQEEYE